MTKAWTQDDLQYELRRRETRLPAWIHGMTKQEITARDLAAELQLIPATDRDREWYEWELALAVEHERSRPGVPFVRYIDLPH